MRQINEAAEVVIVPITGVANIGRDKLSTGKAHFTVVGGLIKRRTHLPIADPVVLEKAGIFGSFEAMCRRFGKDMSRIDEQYPNARKVYAGHSLGGLLGKHYIATTGAAADLITICSPNAPMTGKGILKPFIDWRIADINCFLADIPALNEELTMVSQIATSHDGVIEQSVALAPMTENASLHLIADRVHRHTCEPGVTLHRTVLPDLHGTVLVSEAAITISAIIADMAAARLAAGQSLAA